PPEPVKNCSVKWRSREALAVECLPGNSRGLAQEFHLLIMEEGRVVVNTSSASAEFSVSQLEPGKNYTLVVQAGNSVGTSDPVAISVDLLPLSPSPETGALAKAPWYLLPTLLGSVAGGVVTLGLLVTCLWLVRVKVTGRSRSRPRKPTNHHGKDFHALQDDEQDPDIIPANDVGAKTRSWGSGYDLDALQVLPPPPSFISSASPSPESLVSLGGMPLHRSRSLTGGGTSLLDREVEEGVRVGTFYATLARPKRVNFILEPRVQTSGSMAGVHPPAPPPPPPRREGSSWFPRDPASLVKPCLRRTNSSSMSSPLESSV
ncbi:unnamed protein product, partial [Darwinula stevensoni]